MIDLELCTDNFDGAQAASFFRFKRIELCSAIEVGGLTPSFGLITSCVALKPLEVHVMIRPRPGGFSYSKEELNQMIMDIDLASKTGAKGVVFGCLNHQHDIDIQSTIELVNQAKSLHLETTFHRAIDLCNNWQKALENIINIGMDRVLTSGGQKTAFKGVEQIRKMVEFSSQQLQIMAGSGVNGSNVQTIADTGVNAVHFTARKTIQNNPDLGFGLDYQTDTQKIQDILSSLIQQ